jgi:hypothetical protein
VRNDTRADHLAWCKQRAFEYVNEGDLGGAVASMMSDLGKHPETGVDPTLGMLGLMAATSGDASEVRRFIEGFN